MATTDPDRELLRHTLATVAYRGAKATRGAPDSFAAFRGSDTSRSPAQILAHVGDLFDWALSMAKGAEAWRNSTPKPWPEEIQRYHSSIAPFDEFLGPGEDPES